MSESQKMGLFGSKDENPEAKDDNKDPAKVSDKAPDERIAPYNIDSDSDTYDTEALSIMDINDIIGVQADVAGDSTLESEFAALSEVITNTKNEEFNSKDKDIKGTQDSGISISDRDSGSQTVGKKSSEAVGVSGINKSLQLIGEAYDSDDSQESDNDELATCVQETVKIIETVKTTINEDAEAEAKNSSETVANIVDKKLPEESSIELENSIATDETVALEKSKTEKSAETEKSIDSTDSPATVISTKLNEEEDKTESMAVDAKLGSNFGTSDVETSPCNKTELEIITVVKIVEESRKDLVTVNESEILPAESVVVTEAEPMEVDEPIDETTVEIATEKIDSVSAIDEIIENKLETPNLVTKESNVTETESKKLISDVSDDTQNPPASEISEKFVDNKIPKEEEANTVVEDTKIDAFTTDESFVINKDIIAEKLEMETDNSKVPEFIEEKAKSSVTIVETVLSTIEEVCEEVDEDKVENLQNETTQQCISESSEQVCEISDKTVVERVETLGNEPMEIDDNAGQDSDKKSFDNDPNISSNTLDIVESLANIVESSKRNVEAVDIASDSRVSSSETLATAKDEAIVDASIEESVKVDIDVALSSGLNVTSAKTDANIILEESTTDEPEVSLQNVDSNLVDRSEESANDKPNVSEIAASSESVVTIEAMETEDITPKESSSEEIPSLASEPSEKSPEVEENIPEVITRESFVEVTRDIGVEEEKMEVDGGSKKDKKDKSDSCLDEATTESDEFSVSTSDKVNLLEEKSEIDKPDDSTDVKDSGSKETTSEDVVASKLESTVECHETLDSIDETDEARQAFKDKLSLESIETTEKLTENTLEIEAAASISSVETAKNETEEILESNEEDISSEKINEEEMTRTPVEAIDEKMEDEEKLSELKPSISKTITESTTETNLTDAAETSDEVIEKEAEKIEEETKSEATREENIILNTVEETKVSTEKIEIEESQEIIVAEVTKDETSTLSKEEENKSLVSIEQSEQSTVTSAIEVAEVIDRLEENVDEEQSVAKIQTKESNISSDTSGSQETESTELIVKDCETIDTDKAETERIKSTESADKDPEVERENEEEKIVTEVVEKSKDEKVALIEKEQFEFSKPVIPQQESIRHDLSSSSINPEDVEEAEDPVDEEMNLSLDPEIDECHEPQVKKTIEELSSEKMRKGDGEIEKQVEVNLSLDPEEKNVEVSCSEDSGLAIETVVEKTKQSEERSEKVAETEEDNNDDEDDDEDNSKEIIPSMSSGREIFHDEQSQNTQEMMDSILETDSSNFNKVLDDEEAHIDELAAKLPSASEELLNKALEDPMASQNIDSLEGLLDLDLIQEGDESTMKSVGPIVAKVMNDDDIETKDVDVSLLLAVTDQGESIDRDDYISAAGNNANIISNVVKKITEEIVVPCESLPLNTTAEETIDSSPESKAASSLVKSDVDETFELLNAEPDSEEVVQTTPNEELMEKIDEDKKTDENLSLETTTDEKSEKNLSSQKDLQEKSPADNLLPASDDVQTGSELAEDIPMENPNLEDEKIESTENIIPEEVLIHDQVVTAEIEDLPPTSEISELESAVKFLQESEEQEIDSPLVLSPKLVESVVEEIVREEEKVALFVTEPDICTDSSVIVTELDAIIPDPIAISEAEIITEAAKLENEKKTKLTEEAKLRLPISTIVEKRIEIVKSMPAEVPEAPVTDTPLPSTPKTHREPREISTKSGIAEKIEQAQLLKKSAPIPTISILEERLKEPPKIEIPSVGEVSRMCEMPTTPKTSLLIQRDAKLSSFPIMLESPKSSEKSELKTVETPRKDTDKHDFENVGSPRIILKIAKSAIADCGEPRSPKSPKIRSATNSPNPEDSPGQKLGKIKLKLSKGGHPSIISNDNVEEVCGQWHTEGTSSLSPLGMKIKFSKIADTSSMLQTEKHEEDTKEPIKHKFEEAKRTESSIGMKIKFSKTGDPSIVHQDAKESSTKHKEKIDIIHGSPKRNESLIGMKIKLSKSGDASIIQPEKSEISEDHREAGSSKSKDKLDVSQDAPKRTESPLGIKFKLSKTGDASIVAPEIPEETKRTDTSLGMKIKLSKTRGSASIVPTESSEDNKDRLGVLESPRRTESPLGMKIKFSKSGDASIIHSEDGKETTKHKDRVETNQDSVQIPETSSVVKIKVSKSRETSSLAPEVSEESGTPSVPQKRGESSIGMKFKLSKSGDASIVHTEKKIDDSREKDKPEITQETTRKSDPAIGMKIKLSKTGDASIIQSQSTKKLEDSLATETEHKKSSEIAMPMKIKLQKSGDATLVETEKKEKTTKRKDTDSPLEMKIKLSKTGHPTIIACDNYGESSQRSKESSIESHKHKDSSSQKEISGMKMLKSVHGNVTIEPVQQTRKSESVNEVSSKRKDVTISPIESKKAKLEAHLTQMLPEVTIQPVKPREPKPAGFDAKAGSISRQQMNVISQEISITQVRSKKAMDLSMTDKLKSMLAKNTKTSGNTDCEIIEHRPELIIVNENSNSSQDVMIIEEVPVIRDPEVKVPKKRGRPRRNPLPIVIAKPEQITVSSDQSRDPLALDDPPNLIPKTVTQTVPQRLPPKENERPKRTCSRQKSYAPPKRGRGRGRGKRKLEMDHMELSKKPRIEQDLDMIEKSTTARIPIDESASQKRISHTTSELYKALRQPPMDHKMANAVTRVEAEQAVNDADLLSKDTREALMDSRIMSHLDGVIENSMKKPSVGTETFEPENQMSLESISNYQCPTSTDIATEEIDKSELMIVDVKTVDDTKDNKDTGNTQDHQNWLTPSSKKSIDGRNEGNISNVQVIDEETRMSAESSSRSHTPAKNMSLQAPETIVNEESQGSVLSTATTESEKVKVKNRRMEISFDPDEGPFTVDKVAEYDWPPDPSRKGETFMIQEQISQYLGVKSFKRKYPDLKRRMVDMEERNFLRENALVSEAMCDMGLTAVSSSEVLDIMCNDFPDQYEEYRKYIREKQMKEHSKKQKELTAAANAERNRIDLAEMAVQSALSWNVGLNKARRESRKCSLDLQTFTIHVPKKQQKVEEESRQSNYPVALIPGQYTDYYREYTPAELRYYPLNTVLYGPMKPNERKLDSQSEGSQSDSDSDSSSDDSSSSSSDGTQDTEESQSTMDEVDAEISRQKEDIKNIKCKMCLKTLNKFNRIEVLIQCGTCNGYVHPSCIDLTLDMVPHIQAYAWQCTDCKTCAQCHDPADEDKMLFCDMCDRGYHIYCVGLRRVPQGRWHCQECAVCASCGSREAGGTNSDRNSVAQWQHEYKKGDKNTRVYVSTLCVPCSKLWRKGRYCPHCSRCHTVTRLDLEASLVHCSACDKYLHLGCVETKDLTIGRKNYLCDFCQPNRQQIAKPLVSKVFKT